MTDIRPSDLKTLAIEMATALALGRPLAELARNLRHTARADRALQRAYLELVDAATVIRQLVRLADQLELERRA